MTTTTNVHTMRTHSDGVAHAMWQTVTSGHQHHRHHHRVVCCVVSWNLQTRDSREMVVTQTTDISSSERSSARSLARGEKKKRTAAAAAAVTDAIRLLLSFSRRRRRLRRRHFWVFVCSSRSCLYCCCCSRVASYQWPNKRRLAYTQLPHTCPFLLLLVATATFHHRTRSIITYLFLLSSYRLPLVPNIVPGCCALIYCVHLFIAVILLLSS